MAGLASEYEWDLDGYRAGTGAPSFWRLEVPQFVAYVWWFFTREADEQHRDRFKARLWLPPVSKRDEEITDSSSPWSAESENASFSAFKAQSGL